MPNNDVFSVEITSTSRELSKKERIKMKDTSNAVKLDEVTQDGDFILKPAAYAVLALHNPKSSDNPDYQNIIIIDEAGTKYVTGSPTFMRAFFEIWNEMEGETDYEIVCYKRDSKNYKGKQFLTCSIL